MICICSFLQKDQRLTDTHHESKQTDRMTGLICLKSGKWNSGGYWREQGVKGNLELNLNPQPQPIKLVLFLFQNGSNNPMNNTFTNGNYINLKLSLVSR